ncbi:DUF6262 family protein [Phormidesmis sp. 146-33]
MRNPKQVEALRTATEQKKHQCRQKTVDALSKLIQQGKPISMAAVAREAGVSTVYLYQHPDLRQQIQTLQAQQQQEPKRTQPQAASVQSQGAIISTLRQEIHRLRQENQELKTQVELVYGRLALFSQLQEDNQRLQTLLSHCQQQQHLQLAPLDSAQRVPVTTSPTSSQLQPRQTTAAISEAIQTELAAIGICRPTPSLLRKINAVPEQQTLNALAVVREALASGDVRNPARYFISALEHAWIPNLIELPESTEASLEQFQQWFKLAQAQGLVLGSMKQGDEIVVFDKEGIPQPFSVWLAQYPVEKLESDRQ